MSRKEIFIILFSIAVAYAYDLGVVNKYSYETVTTLDEHCLEENANQVVGHRLTAKVHLTAVWQNPQNPSEKLIQIEISEVKLRVPQKSSFVEHASELDTFTIKPTIILREKGLVRKIWDDPNENYILRNIKRGISDLIYIGKKDQVIKEAGVAGSCDVIYGVVGEHVRKRKANCIHPQIDRSLSQSFGVRSVSTQHLLTSDCKLVNKADDSISKCITTEYVKTFSNFWKKPSLCVNAKSELSLEGVSKGLDTYTNNDYASVIEEFNKSNEGKLEEGVLEASIITKQPNSPSKLSDNVKRYQDSLKKENLAKLRSASAFYKLLPSFRAASKSDISEILQNKKLEHIQGQILDLIAGSSTENSLQAVFAFYEGLKDYDEMLERFLISLSVTPRPKEYIMREIKTFLEANTRHEKIHATLISTLGAVLKTYSQRDGIANDQILEEYRLYLEGKLRECSSKACIITYLRGLRNAAFMRSTPLLLEYALKGGKPALEAISAVRNIEVRLLPAQVQYKLLSVFQQIGEKQDRSVRSIAADILLDLQLDSDVLQAILGSLSDQTDPEFATFLVSKVIQKTEANKELKSRVFRILSKKYISYYSLSQNGGSSVFTKPLIISDDINMTYGIQMEMLAGNLLKRSVFDVSFQQPVVSNLLTVGMFAEGLASLAGGSSEDGADPQAGMELTLLGSVLRPYVFFTGTTELMSHAWSGTASTPTPALQGIFLFSDDERNLVLHNGMIAQVQLRGVLSTDLSASVQISIWSQNSQSQVKNAAAMLMRGAITVDAGFSTIQGAFQFSGQSAIDFGTDLVFSESPFKMCLEMQHPDITVKYDSHRSLSLSGSSYLLKRTKRRKREIPRRSFALHEKNNEQCRLLK